MRSVLRFDDGERSPAGRNPAMTATGYYTLVNAVRHEFSSGVLDDAGVRATYDAALCR